MFMIFYSYVSEFKKDGADDHFYDFITELFSVSENGDLGEYNSMSFKRGEALDEETKKLIFRKNASRLQIH